MVLITAYVSGFCCVRTEILPDTYAGFSTRLPCFYAFSNSHIVFMIKVFRRKCSENFYFAASRFTKYFFQNKKPLKKFFFPTFEGLFLISFMIYSATQRIGMAQASSALHMPADSLRSIRPRPYPGTLYADADQQVASMPVAVRLPVL